MKPPVLPKKTDKDLFRAINQRPGPFFLRHPAISVFCIGLLATIFASSKMREFESVKLQNDFERVAKAAVSTLKDSMRSNLEVLEDIKSFYSASHTVERDEFKKFASYLLARHDSIHALEWIPRVRALEVPAYQEAAWTHEFPRMILTEYTDETEPVPAQKRPEYYPAFYIEPYEENAVLFGLDHASNPFLRQAMEKARDSGKAASSVVLQLPQLKQNTPGMQRGLIIFEPIYHSNMPAESRLEKLQNLYGFAAIVLSIDRLIENSLKNFHEDEVQMRVFAETSRLRNRIIYTYQPSAAVLSKEIWEYQSELEVADRRWLLVCTSTGAFLNHHRRWEAQAMFVVGLLLSLLLAVYVFSFEKSRIREIMAALSLTDELTQLYNRRGLLLLADEQIQFALRRKHGFWLLLADVDQLKKINDTLGHPEGDRALTRVARLLQDSFRKSDIIARIGGDEFAIMVLDAVPVSLQTLLEHLKEQLSTHNAEKKNDYAISISVGAAYFDPNNPCLFDDLIARADRELYKQKKERPLPDEDL